MGAGEREEGGGGAEVGGGGGRGGGAKFWCQLKCFIDFPLQVARKSLWNRIPFIFLHDFIHEYSTRVGTSSQQKGLCYLLYEGRWLFHCSISTWNLKQINTITCMELSNTWFQTYAVHHKAWSVPMPKFTKGHNS